MTRYDPHAGPEPMMWLAMDETERLDIIRQYHRRDRTKLPSLDAHAAIHVAVENQLAEGFVPAAGALQRLLAGGIDRHEAIHAIGSVLAGHIWNIANKPVPEGDPHAPYSAALNELTPASWRSSASR